jgi:hypothetical protein
MGHDHRWDAVDKGVAIAVMTVETEHGHQGSVVLKDAITVTLGHGYQAPGMDEGAVVLGVVLHTLLVLLSLMVFCAIKERSRKYRRGRRNEDEEEHNEVFDLGPGVPYHIFLK